VALGYFAYNFIKIHRALRVTPAMASGVTNRLWDVEDLVAAWEARRTEVGKSGVSVGRFFVPLTISFVLSAVAGLSATLFLFMKNESALNLFMVSAVIIGPIWAIPAFRLLWRYGKDALWVLVGLPPALSCTGLLCSLLLSCFIGSGSGCL
jgi:hypothetical protein